MIEKMIRAARLDISLYEEVEHDETATTEAMMVVILVSILSGLGSGIGALMSGERGFVGLIMAVGAVFGTMNTMYAIVAARTREIGTLRSLGFSRRSILASFLVESVLLSLVGGAIGAALAIRVQMTAMPQLVAAFNGFGGAASALVALAEMQRENAVFSAEVGTTVALSLAIGTITFSGSFVAFAKLQGLISGRPLSFTGAQVLNGIMAAAVVALSIWAVTGDVAAAYWAVVAGVEFEPEPGGGRPPWAAP